MDIHLNTLVFNDLHLVPIVTDDGHFGMLLVGLDLQFKISLAYLLSR